MAEAAAAITPEAVALLLDILELPDPILSGHAAADLDPDATRVLGALGLLHPAGHEASAASEADDSDTPVSLIWCPDRVTYGYFSASTGWCPVAGDRLQRYRVDPAEVMVKITAGFRRPHGSATAELIAGTLWDLGDVRLPGRVSTISLWYCRRLFDTGIWHAVRGQARARLPPQRRVLLTSTRAARLIEGDMSRHTVIALRDVLAPGPKLVIDPAVLTARLDGVPAASTDDAIQVIGDGREVSFLGKIYRFPKGDSQRRVIMLLYEAYLGGESAVPSAGIIERLDLERTRRLKDLFRGSPAWGHLLEERSGMCGFCWPARDGE